MYATLLQRLHDICLVKMLMNQSELIDPSERDSDQQKFQYRHYTDKIRHRIANYILETGNATPLQSNPDFSATLQSIKPTEEAKQQNPISQMPVNAESSIRTSTKQSSSASKALQQSSGRRSHQARQSKMGGSMQSRNKNNSSKTPNKPQPTKSQQTKKAGKPQVKTTAKKNADSPVQHRYRVQENYQTLFEGDPFVYTMPPSQSFAGAASTQKSMSAQIGTLFAMDVTPDQFDETGRFNQLTSSMYLGSEVQNTTSQAATNTVQSSVMADFLENDLLVDHI